MRFHRFYVREKLGVGENAVVSNPELTHQLKRVFRLKTGDTVVLFNGDGFEYVSEIKGFEKDTATFRVSETKKSLMPTKTNALYPSLIKKDKLEWVIQKCTELGIAEFHPVISERSEKKSFDLKRMEKIAIEATEQSGWGRVPTIYEPVNLTEALSKAKNPVILDMDGSGFSGEKAISIFIGPEGGWTDAERKTFSDMNIPILSIGNQTLRAETASIAVAARL